MSPQPEPVAHGTPSKIHAPTPPTSSGGFRRSYRRRETSPAVARQATYPLRRSPGL